MWKRTELVVKEWEKDLVYLVQFPRSASGATVSPFSLKVETWLRMADLPYKNVSNEFRLWSKKGQIPFIEYNGEETADSSVIISKLSAINTPPMDGKLSSRDKGIARALQSIFENNIWWACFYERAKNVPAHYSSPLALGRQLSGLNAWIVPFFFATLQQRGFTNRARSVGVGRLTQDELEVQFRADLTAVKDLLGENKYLMGDQAATVDACAYGHLVMHECCPVDTSLKKILHTEYPTLIAYLARIRETYWPDWNECIEKLSLDTEYKKSEAK